MTLCRPTEFETFGEGLFELVAREKAGEFVILYMKVGPRNDQYTVKVRYPTDKQPELLTP